MSQFILRGAITPSIFPLATSANGRYLVNASSVPFPILARAYWGIIGLSPANYQAAIADLLAKGFNALEFRAPNASQQDNFAPLDGASNLPFTTKIGGGSYTGAFTEDPDFTTPNEAYWVFLDTFLAYCETQGVAVLWFPKYIGFSNTEGWRREYVANGTTKCQTYGAYVANRYKARKNIIWMLGGDTGTSSNPWVNQSEIDCESAYITGLKSVSGQASTQYCAEWASGSFGDDETNFGSQLTINGAYSWEALTAQYANSGYQDTPTKPTILLEEPYDEEGTDGTNKNPGNAIQPTRKYVFRSVLNGANAGYCEGNGYLTHFFNDVPHGDYRNHFSTVNQVALASFNAWYKTIAWYDLIPHDVRNIITSGRGSTDTDGYVAGASTADGALAVFYAGVSFTSFTVDMTKMRGTTTCTWIDPTSGATSSAGGPFANTGTRTFNDPGNNAQGEGDWFLKLVA